LPQRAPQRFQNCFPSSWFTQGGSAKAGPTRGSQGGPSKAGQQGRSLRVGSLRGCPKEGLKSSDAQGSRPGGPMAVSPSVVHKERPPRGFQGVVPLGVPRGGCAESVAPRGFAERCPPWGVAARVRWGMYRGFFRRLSPTWCPPRLLPQWVSHRGQQDGSPKGEPRKGFLEGVTQSGFRKRDSSRVVTKGSPASGVHHGVSNKGAHQGESP
jgi:hypothetical protein